MSVRFLVLFPDDHAEAAMAAHVVDVLKRTHPDSWICRLIQKDYLWISDGYPGWDDTLIFEKTPGEKKFEILDKLPDYLIDLSGNGKFWLFKNRLRLVDFSFSAKALKTIRTNSDYNSQYNSYTEELAKLLSVFDLQPFHRLTWQVETQKILDARLPKAFVKSYLSLNIDDFLDNDIPHFDKIIKDLSALDFPFVLTGSMDKREMGDRISKTVGCTVFNTAGDLNVEEQRVIYSAAKGFYGVSQRIRIWSFLTRKDFIDATEVINVDEIKKRVET